MAAPPRKRLWLGAAGAALFVGTIFCAHALLPSPQRHDRGVGVDFIAFYTAGTFVREHRPGQLYDLEAVSKFQHELARQYGADIGQAYGPWWNPPFYALPFAVLSRLPYFAALDVWMIINLLSAGVACWLLRRMLPAGTEWRSWALAPVLMALSMPFIYALSHAQNTCTSLLLLTIAVTLWRWSDGRKTSWSWRGFWAGAVAALLAYKPQLAAVLVVVLVADLGLPALAGCVFTAAFLLLINVLLLPGTLHDYLHRLPANLELVQTQGVYLWERHVTLKAFWRLLLQGHARGETSIAVRILTIGSAAALALPLAKSVLRRWLGKAGEEGIGRRDRLICATIAATPLLMPFYFDYDLLLLAIPVVLFAGAMMATSASIPTLTLPRSTGAGNKQGALQQRPALDRWLLRFWAAFYVWLMLNPDVAERTRLNLAVPLLWVICSLSIARINRTESSDASESSIEPFASLPKAA